MFHRRLERSARLVSVARRQRHARAGTDGRRTRDDEEPESAGVDAGEPSAHRRSSVPGAPTSYVVVRKAVAAKKIKIAQLRSRRRARSRADRCIERTVVNKVPGERMSEPRQRGVGPRDKVKKI